MIHTTGLTRKFGNFVAVKDLNLQVHKGVIFGFLGPNGSGKSTTVKMLTGILRPSAGDALIDGSSILSSPVEIKRKIGVLPEDTGASWKITGVVLLSLALYLFSLSRAAQALESRREEIREALS